MSAAPPSVARLLPPPRAGAGDAFRVCAVCTGNICRSPMAEVVLRDLLATRGLADRVVVDSAGISGEEVGRPMHPGTQRVLRSAGLPSVEHRARRFEPGWIRGYDLVLAMAGGHRRALLSHAARFAVEPGRVVLLGDLDPAGSTGDVPDPWGMSDAAFREVFDQLAPPLRALADALAHALDRRDPA